MSEFNSILVGIDYSENGASALREASRIANWNEAKLVCLHVLDEEIFDDFRSHDEFDEMGVRASALEHLEKYVADTLGAVLKYQDDIQKLQGSEAKRILDEASSTLQPS